MNSVNEETQKMNRIGGAHTGGFHAGKGTYIEDEDARPPVVSFCR